ncbi:hypothetical protein [Streptomyces sp. CAU 1734]|uniref:hypothetical protein n=1 Tax=Streptomyces sp. CAU 1734 TaxID=3140360 RepID=UPI0032601380
MSSRLSLRALAVAGAAISAVLAPAGVAFADSTTPASPSPAVKSKSEKPAPAPARDAKVVKLPRGGVAAGDKPSPAVQEKRKAGERQIFDLSRDAKVVKLPRGGVAAGDKPSPAVKEKRGAGDTRVIDLSRDGKATTPRGGVAAGEQPAAAGGSGNTAVIVGSVAGFALLAGASTLVIRRRGAAPAGANG